MSTWASLEPAATTVDPGSSTTVRLRIRNTSDVVEEYRVNPVGDLAPHIRVEPSVLRLYPGTTGTAEVTLSPPRTPDVPAGPNPFALEITPAEHPDQVAVPEGNLTVTPFHEVRAELVPGSVRGRWRGRPQLAVDNLGNTEVTASLRGHDQASDLRYDMRPNTVQIPPGRARFVRLGLRPSRFLWAGREQKHDYTVDVQRAGAKPVAAQGQYVQPALFAGWLSRLLMLLVMLLVAFIVLWFTFRPSISTAASPQPNNSPAGAVVAPSNSVPPPPSPTPQKSPDGNQNGAAPSPRVPSNPNAARGQHADERQVTLESGQNLYLVTGREPMGDGSAFLTAPWDSQSWSNTYYSVFRYPDNSVGIEVLRRPGSVMEEQPNPNMQPLHDIQLSNGVQDLKNGNINSAQRWNLVPVGGGYFQIVNQKTGDCLTDDTSLPVNPDAAGFAAGRPCANGVTDQQRWKFTPAGN
ncbi:RICIN domain-containing protein [Streptomyces sp. RPT161]|uniref:RICIN domain-containing protein n=1 Tax=Streptomyces sp. RPT161 TaxID=3015993 RepID=UPI0022B87DA8|nr:RICIN domain-containing protein [Streptomyces sp. RPT161]